MTAIRSAAIKLCLSLLVVLTLSCMVYSQTVPTTAPATQPAGRRGRGGRGGRGGGRAAAPVPTNWTTTRPDGPVEPGAMLQHLGTGYGFTEGATSDDKGNVFFVDQNNDSIMKYSVDDGAITQWMHPTGRSNGMCFDSKGNLISCADEKNELWEITPDKKVTVIVKNFKDKLLNGPNDVWIRPDGGMYLTDPLYARQWWQGFRTNAPQQPGNYVYFLSPDRKTLTPVITDFNTPNGIIGTPDGKTLYVSDISGHLTYSYTIQPNGSLTDKKLFAPIGSDGMTIDSDGNVYTTGYNFLTIFDKTGKQLEQISPIPCANVCFGGKDGHLLFICAGTEVWGLKMRTSRVGPQ